METSPPSTVNKGGTGTAVAISRNGYLLTNHHVVEDCNILKIRKGGKSLNAKLISTDAVNDLALLKIDIGETNFLGFGTRPEQPLEKIYVAGFPYGDLLSSSMKTTDGIVSAVSGPGNNFSMLQISAPLQPGNSGGPIVNENGEVIGVAVAALNKKLVEKYTCSIPENINFGVTSSVA